MICLFEPQCLAWAHETVNSGVLNLILEQSDENVVVACEKQHFNCITVNIDKAKLQRVTFYPFIPEFDVNIDTLAVSSIYEKYIKSVLTNYPDITNFIMLSSHRGNMESVYKISKSYLYIHFHVVVHAIMENLIKDNLVDEEPFSLAEMINKMGGCKNIDFYIYNPLLKKYACDILTDEVLSKFSFIHHPIICLDDTNNDVREDEIVIGIFGACNRFSKKIVENIRWTGHGKFVSVSGGKPYGDLDYVSYINDGNRVSRDLIDITAKSTDLYLLPYNKTQYVISISGILIDSISYCKPAIMLDSPILKYYNERFDIGYQFDDERKMINFIELVFNSSELPNDYFKKQDNIKHAVSVMKDENKITIGNLLRG